MPREKAPKQSSLHVHLKFSKREMDRIRAASEEECIPVATWCRAKLRRVLRTAAPAGADEMIADLRRAAREANEEIGGD